MVISIKTNLTDSNELGPVITYNSEGNPKSYLYSDTWDYTGSVEVSNLVTPVISFRKIRLEYRRKIQDTLNELYKFSVTQNKIGASWSMLDSLKVGLTHIAECIESTDWSSLEDSNQYKHFRQKLKGRNLSRGSIEGFIIPTLNKLQQAGLLNRLIDGRKVVESAISHVTQQHIAIPTKMYQTLLSNSIKVVETFYPYKDQISKTMADAYYLAGQIQSGFDTRTIRRDTPLSMDEWAIRARVTRALEKIEHGIPDFKIDMNGYQIGEIQTACMTVILSFSGMRLGEACSLNLDSFKKRRLSKGIEASFIKGKSTKGYDGRPKSHVWVTHHVTKDAIELAFTISNYLRDIYKNKIEKMKDELEMGLDEYEKALKDLTVAFLAVKPQQQTARFVGSSFASRIRNLANKWSIRATQEDVIEFDMLNPTRKGQLKVGETLKKLSPHDFRRSFAVFFVRHGFGNTSGIKFQYKHKNINMSGYYSANAELARMEDILLDHDLLNELEEAGIDLGVDIFDEIYNKSEYLSGVAGESVMREKERALKNGQKVFMSRLELDNLVRNGTLSAVMLPGGGYCTNENCERVCSMFAVGKSDCQFEIIDDKGARKKADRRDRLIKKFLALNDGDSMKKSILVSLKQEILFIEQTLRKHKISFTPFTEALVV